MAHRDWCYTINNPVQSDKDVIASWLKQGKAVTFTVWQLEVGDEGTQHIQGYAEFNQPITLSRLKNGYHAKAHWEPRFGSQAQCITYCTKNDTRVQGPFELGTPKSQGKRSDLVEMSELIKAGKSMLDVANHSPSTYIRCYRGLEKYQQLLRTKSVRNLPPDVIVLWGPPGTGKTRQVYESSDDVFMLPSANGGKVWFDGYNGQNTLLIDDFDGKDIPYRYLLKLLDRYPCQVEVKGGFVNFNSPEIYITSNINPEHWYPEEDYEPLLRRLTSITELKKPQPVSYSIDWTEWLEPKKLTSPIRE